MYTSESVEFVFFIIFVIIVFAALLYLCYLCKNGDILKDISNIEKNQQSVNGEFDFEVSSLIPISSSYCIYHTWTLEAGVQYSPRVAKKQSSSFRALEIQ